MNLAAEVAELRRRRTERPLPRVRVEHGRTVPVWVLRTAAGAAVAALVLASGRRSGLVLEPVVVLAVLLAAWAVWRPGGLSAHLAVLLAGLMLLGSSVSPVDPAVFWIAPCGYLAVRLCWWAGRSGLRSRVELAVLRRSGGRDLAVVAASLVVGGGAWLVAGVPVGGLVVIGGAALLALAWSLLPR
ncbi:hypothetical protein GCM10009718_23590 [Isoptericola halotolerans]|uniref:Uncharacterized protein n=1 Tax=Isoptericola halotolerans TaxID=300560 RepID=A0ABX2A5I1_9MICO|nr:hypothetical protein [Isoptericola halotolerans]NOV98078.1 hypothetical protein [Isoptericola halotolerans]